MAAASVDRIRNLLLNVSAILVLALSFSAKAALADNAFLLQLGMFDTEEKADQKWDEVKSQNGDLLDGLNLHVAEVSLPPDNKTTYRTQAGPLTDREKAVSLCNQLQTRGVKCYVVETAMFSTGTAAGQQEAAAKSAPEEKAAVPQAKHAPAAQAAEEDTAHADDPDYIPPPVDSGPVIISSTGAPAAPAVSSPAELAEMPITPAPAANPAKPAPVQVAEAEVPTPAAKAASRDDDDEVPAPEVKKSVATATPSGTPSSHYVAGREPHFLDSETSVASAPPPASPVAPAPAQPKESRGFFSRLFGSSPSPEPAPVPSSPPTNSNGVVGSVNVAEAVRVPLSSGNQPPAQKIVPVLPQVHGLGGTPSSPTDKTLWAQVSYFRNEEQALTFYRQFAAAYPQFTDGIRIRITRPFGVSANAARVSLRVGPFAGADDVRTICAAAARWSARCTVVRDIGASVAMNAAPEHAAARTRGERAVTAIPGGKPGQYWAQLGTYHSSQDAWDAWRELKATHRRIAARMHPSVTTPPTSSADNGVYRLRSGPFTSEDRAAELCNKLQAVSEDCLVVNDR